MKKEDWDKLCRNIFEQKCILLLGSDFPLETNSGEEVTSFSKLLSQKLRDELISFDSIPERVKRNLSDKESSQLASDYIHFKQMDKKLSREDLEYFLEDCLNEAESNFQSSSFVKLSSLPFNFIVNTNYTNFFANQLRKANKVPETAYYNLKGDKVELINSDSSDRLGTELHPFVFNLFGSIDNPRSLVISENDMVQFIINIISRNPGLPANVKSELADQEKCFLFLGFDFYEKNWYFRILLQALESNNKGRMSYALECIDNIQSQSFDDNPIVLFFRDELKVSLCAEDQQQFINTLVENYNAFQEKRKSTSPDRPQFENAPKAFISYKSEDYTAVFEIYQRLRKLGINAWLDRERLSGTWKSTITNEILNSDAFILIQSRQLRNNPVNYINVEIKDALERSRFYQPISDFIFPTFIDNAESVITEYPSLLEVNSYDLSNLDKIEQLAKDIKRSYERNKRKRAA